MTPEQLASEKRLGPLKFYLGWRLSAGLIRVVYGKWHLHLGVHPNHWTWGHKVEEYDQCADYWGAGPIFLVAK